MTTAEQIAKLFADDGLRYQLEDGRTLTEVCAAESLSERDDSPNGVTKWVFPDRSVIVDSGAGWDIGLSPDCACMQGAGHAEDCSGKRPERCMCQCDCGNSACETDIDGHPVCDECAVYMNVPGGVVCGYMTEGFDRCHVCSTDIDWSGVLTGYAAGQSNYRTGSCECGSEAWTVEEDGGSWDRYSYSA